MDKKIMRNDIIAQLQNINEQTYFDRSKIIIDQLMDMEVFQQAETIGITISRFPEVDTKAFIERAWALGKRIAIPKCIPATREMDFRIFSSYEDLEEVYVQLLEPVVEKTKAVKRTDIDLLVVPGVVYNPQGYRIGFGGGYYDRYLTEFKAPTVSLAFKEQIQEVIPIEEHDIAVDVIITDEQVIQCKKEG